MSIYRNGDGEEVLRDWCEARMETWPDHERVTISTSLGPTHLAITGTASPAVLWLPGTNFNAATSSRLVGHLGARFRTYVVDLPGQPGLSSSVRLGGDRIARYGHWLAEVVSEIDEPELLIAGHSLGAAIALAAEPQDEVSGLALFSPAGLIRLRITTKLLRVSTRWALRPTLKSSAELARYMQAPASSDEPELAEWLMLVARHTKPEGAPGPVPAPKRERWRGKALVAVGEADAFFESAKLEEAARESLGTTVRVVEGAGHLLPDEQPQAVLEMLTELAAAKP